MELGGGCRLVVLVGVGVLGCRWVELGGEASGNWPGRILGCGWVDVGRRMFRAEGALGAGWEE